MDINSLVLLMKYFMNTKQFFFKKTEIKFKGGIYFGKKNYIYTEINIILGHEIVSFQ